MHTFILIAELIQTVIPWSPFNYIIALQSIIYYVFPIFALCSDSSIGASSPHRILVIREQLVVPHISRQLPQGRTRVPNEAGDLSKMKD